MAVEVIEVFDVPTEVVEVLVAGPQGPEGPLQGVSYLLVTSAQTLEKDAKIAADTSGGAFTLTLPANPEAGDAIEFYDYAGTWNSNNLTIARNGEKIEGENQDLACNISGGYFTLIYSGETRGWQVLPHYGVSGASAVSGVAPIVSSGGVTPSISISPATTSTAGSMSASDKLKLDGISAGSNLPLDLGTSSAGSSSNYSREDHVHASETSNDFEITDFTKGIVLRSPDTSRWRITIDNDGVLTSTKL